MKIEYFIETSQVASLRNAISEALDAGAGYPTIVMGYGDPGMGKTWAARKLYVEFGGYYLRIMGGTSQFTFLQDLCYEITGTRPRSSALCTRAIVKKLEDEPAPIFADEIDNAVIGRMEDLRYITDVTGAPVIFIGESALPTKVAARDRINDRIPETFRVNFSGINRKDIMLYAQKACEISLTPEAGGVVYDKTNKGIFRRVDNAIKALKNAAKAAGTTEVSAEMARQILKAKG